MHLRVVPLPKVAPIIPIKRPLPFDDPDWLFEPKFDGFRGLKVKNRAYSQMTEGRFERFNRKR